MELAPVQQQADPSSLSFLSDPAVWTAASILLALLALLVFMRRRVRRAALGEADDGSGLARLLGGAVPQPAGAAPAALRNLECLWSRDRFRQDAEQHRWVCGRCGAETFTRVAVAPGDCLARERRPGEA